MRRSIVLAAVLALAAVLVTAAWARHAATPVLTGTDGPGFTINLKMNGKSVKTLKAGAYKVVISTALTASQRTSARSRSRARRPSF